jgi:hypothetical protein
MKENNNNKKITQGFEGLNLERVFDVTNFEEILKSSMHRGFLNFSLKFAQTFEFESSIWCS